VRGRVDLGDGDGRAVVRGLRDGSHVDRGQRTHCLSVVCVSSP
jgi:hypothetical protein